MRRSAHSRPGCRLGSSGAVVSATYEPGPRFSVAASASGRRPRRRTYLRWRTPLPWMTISGFASTLSSVIEPGKPWPPPEEHRRQRDGDLVGERPRPPPHRASDRSRRSSPAALSTPLRPHRMLRREGSTRQRSAAYRPDPFTKAAGAVDRIRLGVSVGTRASRAPTSVARDLARGHAEGEGEGDHGERQDAVRPRSGRGRRGPGRRAQG
jgi:hypothetical protein